MSEENVDVNANLDVGYDEGEDEIEDEPDDTLEIDKEAITAEVDRLTAILGAGKNINMNDVMIFVLNAVKSLAKDDGNTVTII